MPVLLAGTGIGLAAGVAGGTAAVTEKVMKSRQMSVAKLALVNFIVFSPLSETTVLSNDFVVINDNRKGLHPIFM